MGILGVLSVIIGLFGAAITPHSEAPFLLQALLDSVVAFFMLVVLAVGVILYFLPTIFALRNKKRLALLVAVLNFFLGWTVIGWWLLLAWGNTPEKEDWRRL